MSLAELLHELGDAIGASPDDPLAAVDALVSTSEVRGGRVTRRGRSIVVAFDSLDVMVRLGDPDDGRGAVSATDIARAANDGSLTGELDAAVDWDPDLAV